MSMATYLSNKIAEYTTIELSIAPHRILSQKGSVNQRIINSYANSVAVIKYQGDQTFLVTLEWIYLSDTDAETIRSLFHSESKADKYSKTFYWQHPKDSETYTVRFVSPLTTAYSASMPNGQQVQQVQLRVEGVKP